MRKNFLILLLFIPLFLFAQIEEEPVNATGLEMDVEACMKIPECPSLLTRDYQQLPSSFSLKKYCPVALSQREFGTCCVWACAYETRTIAEAIKNEWTDSVTINEQAFSPLFVYAQIKHEGDSECKRGVSPSNALEIMKTKGCAKFKSFDVYCAEYISSDLFNEAENFKIDDYFTLWNTNLHDSCAKVNLAKKSISQYCPVVICMNLYDSFFASYNKDCWDGEMKGTPRLHAMTIVGYDDSKYDGAFLIMNSWGQKWGKNGFIWVKYSDFVKTVDWAYEIYVNKHIQPSPVPSKDPQLSGSMQLVLATGEEMKVNLQKNTSVPCYKIDGEYLSGTRYRLYVSNGEPAYVYIIGSDLTNSVTKVFPPTDNISAALTYKSSHIAIPDENFYIEMDNTVGTDYMCVIYSKIQLDINSVIENIKNQEGDFKTKVAKALDGNYPNISNIKLGDDSIDFSTSSEKNTVPVIMELTHK